jgi:membrane dipeptidase
MTTEGDPTTDAENANIAAILASTDVWEMMLPWPPIYWSMEILARYKHAGYTYVSATIGDWPPTFDGIRQCVKRFREIAAPHEDWLLFGHSLADIDRGREQGKLVIGLNSQETRVLEADLTRVETLRELGVRQMVLAYNVRNLVADGCAEIADAGLSNFGRRVVGEMDRVGIIVDGSHTGRRSSLEAIELSERPVIFSHSGAYGVHAHIRNLRDDQIRACAANGGVVGVVGLGQFLGDVAARTESMFRHIDYISTLVGPDHVGIGTDFVPFMPFKDYTAVFDAHVPVDTSWPGLDRTNAWPDQMPVQLPRDECRCVQPEQLGELVEIMLRQGYSTEAVRGILGGNFKRVYATLP